MMKTVAMTAMVCGALALAACGARVGNDFNMGMADQLMPGVTTVDQAMSLIGTPESTSVDASGDTHVSWAYGEAGPGGSYGKRLTVVFDKDKKMMRIEKRAVREGRHTRTG